MISRLEICNKVDEYLETLLIDKKVSNDTIKNEIIDQFHKFFSDFLWDDVEYYLQYIKDQGMSYSIIHDKSGLKIESNKEYYFDLHTIVQTIKTVYDKTKHNFCILEFPQFGGGNSYNLKDADLSEFEKLDKLKALNISNNQIVKLLNLPPNLLALELDGNEIEVLPPLPDTIQVLSISHNKIKKIEKLPSNLKILKADNNLIEELPELPETMTNIILNNNKLYSLPKLPANIESINVNGNFLPTTNFDELKKIYV